MMHTEHATTIPYTIPCRHAVLRRQNSTVLACIALPILVLLTVFIGLFFVLYKVMRAAVQVSGW
jgi:hypothetical protein